MSSLYARIEEFQHILTVLARDLEYLRPQLGSRLVGDETGPDEFAVRRAYVRAAFALIEGMTEQYSAVLIDLSQAGLIDLPLGRHEVLAPYAYAPSDSGTIVARPQYLTLERKLRVVARASDSAFDGRMGDRFADEAWKSFRGAIATRNSLAHPKCVGDCYVEDEQLDMVDAVGDWFTSLHNEFVRSATKHRQATGWKADSERHTRPGAAPRRTGLQTET